MSETSPAEAPPVRKGGSQPAWPAVGSALLLWTTFPPAGWSWLAWVALVPLFVLVRSERRPLALYLGAWAGGMVFWTLAVSWVRLTDPTAWVAWLTMALALSFFWPLFLALARVAVRELRLPMMVAAPVVWVALEYVRAYVLTGFPWYYLAHSQHAVIPVIQVSDFAGSLGVSLVIAVVNAWWADLLTLPLLRPTPAGPRLALGQRSRLAWVAAALGGTLVYGGYRLATASFRPGPRVALLQSNLLQEYKQGRDSQSLLEIYRRLVERAGQATPRPDLIVWPETSFPYQYASIAPGLAPEEMERQVKSIAETFTVASWTTRAADVSGVMRRWVDGVGVPMLYGVPSYVHGPAGVSHYNSAVLVQPGAAAWQSYHKLHLVPFGEYVPLIEAMPWLTVFTPYHGPDARVPSLNFGRAPSWLDLGPYRLATAICFEDTVPQVVRRFFAEVKDGRAPDALLNLSNDGWFHGSSEHDMHLAVSVFRAVENRVPLARAANTGVSAIVDGNGRVLDSLPKLTEGVLAGILPLDDRAAPYSRWGDWLGRSCLAVTLGLVPLQRLRPSFRRRKAVI